MDLQAMQLNDEQMHTIGNYVKLHILEWIDERSPDIELRERMIRVEESLEKQYELMKLGFAQMDKRFEEMTASTNKHFEQVDKRFEEMTTNSNTRFAQVDKRFEELRTDMNQHFKQMFTYFSTGIILLGVLMSVYQFLT